MTQFIDMWKRAFDFNGRSTRSEFWFAYLFTMIIYIVLAGLNAATDGNLVFLVGIYGLAFIVPYIALTIRRLHDIGKSGFWIFIPLVPIAGSIWFLVLLCTPTLEYGNQFASAQ